MLQLSRNLVVRAVWCSQIISLDSQIVPYVFRDRQPDAQGQHSHFSILMLMLKVFLFLFSLTVYHDRYIVPLYLIRSVKISV